MNSYADLAFKSFVEHCPFSSILRVYNIFIFIVALHIMLFVLHSIHLDVSFLSTVFGN